MLSESQFVSISGEIVAVVAQTLNGPKSGTHSGPWTTSEISAILLIAGILVGFVAIIFVRCHRGPRRSRNHVE